MAERDANQAVYVISVAAELTGMHPQTLRIYERKGLLDPSRTSGGSRRFSESDLARLRHIQELTATGLNLEGVRRVLQLEAELARCATSWPRCGRQALDAVAATHRQYRRDLVPLRQAPVPYRVRRQGANGERRQVTRTAPDGARRARRDATQWTQRT